jgi:hypothetical protein
VKKSSIGDRRARVNRPKQRKYRSWQHSSNQSVAARMIFLTLRGLWLGAGSIRLPAPARSGCDPRGCRSAEAIAPHGTQNLYLQVTSIFPFRKKNQRPERRGECFTGDSKLAANRRHFLDVQNLGLSARGCVITMPPEAEQSVGKYWGIRYIIAANSPYATDSVSQWRDYGRFSGRTHGPGQADLSCINTAGSIATRFELAQEHPDHYDCDAWG